MALFGGARDMALLSKLNKELINDIVDTEVYYYMLAVEETKSNLYGESKNKMYHQPIKVPCLFEWIQATQISDDFGQSYTREVTFNFLKDTLIEKGLKPEIGDVVQYNDTFFLIDTHYERQYFAGKNPETWDGGESQGWSISIICDAHATRETSLNLVDNRFGNSNQNTNTIPMGL